MSDEATRDRKRKQYQKNREKIRTAQREYYQDNREEILARIKSNQLAHPEIHANYMKTHHQNYLEYARTSYGKLRSEVIEHYGGKCACCGETTREFLAIDHINGGGTEHKKSIGGCGNLCRWLKNNGYPDGFQILCHNCNHGRYLNGGICPHKRKAE